MTMTADELRELAAELHARVIEATKRLDYAKQLVAVRHHGLDSQLDMFAEAVVCRDITSTARLRQEIHEAVSQIGDDEQYASDCEDEVFDLRWQRQETLELARFSDRDGSNKGGTGR